jgi:hypothetical protein
MPRFDPRKKARSILQEALDSLHKALESLEAGPAPAPPVTDIRAAYAPGQVKITTTVEGRRVSITLTPTRAQGLAHEISVAVQGALRDKP